MSIQRLSTTGGKVRYKARVKSHGRQVAARTFDRRADAVAWEQDQVRRLRLGDWIDPRRGHVTVSFVAEAWLLTRDGVKRRTRETDRFVWASYVAPAFGRRSVASLTSAEIAEWAAQLIAGGRSPATSRRALSTLRSILGHAIADERIVRNPAARVKALRGGVTREGQALTEVEVAALAAACRGPMSDIVILLAYTGLRWGELAGLRVGDQICVPGPGLRLQRAALAGGGGDLFIDSLKDHQARTVPLTSHAADIVAHWGRNRPPSEWLFSTSAGTPLREGNWKRAVKWTAAKQSIGKPDLRVDLRH
nr:tyrosine-type recombinase/integrase [Actinomycetota bacterium]